MKKLIANSVPVLESNMGSQTALKKYFHHVLSRIGENVCFRCGLAIEDFRQMSLDHKERHEGDVEKFWNTSNLTVSHFRCNVAANGASDKHWITNGDVESLIHRTISIPDGWYKGRCQKVMDACREGRLGWRKQ